MNFATVKGLTIPEGNVESIAIGGQTVWTKPVDDPWAAVFKAINDGTYKEKYAIGDTVPLDLGSEGVVNMQIAGFDVDDLADGSGKAPISWISKELLITRQSMNTGLVTNDDGTYQEGTGMIGGWEKCVMRTYLNDTIKPMIPEEVRNGIVAVTKTQSAYDTSGSSVTQTTEDDVWIPSREECVGSSSMYYALFKDESDKRKKYIVGSSRATDWWLRSSIYDVAECDYVASSGGNSRTRTYYLMGIALCFCT